MGNFNRHKLRNVSTASIAIVASSFCCKSQFKLLHNHKPEQEHFLTTIDLQLITGKNVSSDQHFMNIPGKRSCKERISKHNENVKKYVTQGRHSSGERSSASWQKQHIINNLFWHFQLCSTQASHAILWNVSIYRSFKSRILILREMLRINFENFYIANCHWVTLVARLMSITNRYWR